MANGMIDEEEDERSFRILLLSIITFLTIMMFFISGSLKWVIGLSIILFLGVILIFEIYNRSAEISFWKRDNELDSIVNLNLERMSEIAGRAYHDKTISKSLFEERVKEEFIKKLKNYKNISDAEMERLMENPKELREIIDDDMITKFILESKSYNQAVHEQATTKKSFTQKFGLAKITVDKDYKDKINEILERMEEWN
ncbi:MAG: hypothetical protein ACOC5D_00920 [Thermoplasmatota archaeon]